MSNIKEKAKNFIGENKIKLIASGAAVAVIGIGAIVYSKAYYKGFLNGGAVGGYVMIDFLDKTFPEESHAMELFERYAKEHPDKIAYRKI